MMMMRVMSVMVGLMVVVHAEKGKASEMKESNTSDFELLCNIMKATTGVWQTSFYEDFQDDTEQKKLDEAIKETFFGKKRNGQGMGHWSLPDKFEGNNPNRSEVCGSTQTSTSDGMPSASESMVSAFFCLCTRTEKIEKDLCGLSVEVKETWPEKNGNVQRIFRELWGNLGDGKIIENCDHPATDDDLKVAKENLAKNISTLQTALKEANGILGEHKSPFDASTVCAKVTDEPKWFKSLKNVAEIAETILKLGQEAKERKELELKATKQDAFTPKHEESPQHAAAAVTEPVRASAHEATPKQEKLKVPEERPNSKPKAEPEPEEKPVDTPQKHSEDSTPPPENETSGSFLPSPKWPLLAALLC